MDGGRGRGAQGAQGTACIQLEASVAGVKAGCVVQVFLRVLGNTSLTAAALAGSRNDPKALVWNLQ